MRQMGTACTALRGRLPPAALALHLCQPRTFRLIKGLRRPGLWPLVCCHYSCSEEEAGQVYLCSNGAEFAGVLLLPPFLFTSTPPARNRCEAECSRLILPHPQRKRRCGVVNKRNHLAAFILGALFIAGCGNSKSFTPTQPPGGIAVSLTLTDTPPANVDVIAFEVTVSGAALNPGRIDFLGA